MKTNFRKLMSVIAVALAVTMSVTSCRKDDDEPQGPAYNTTEIQNSMTNATPVPDYVSATSTVGKLESIVNFGTSGTIADVSKMYVEVNLAHLYAGDISMALKAPDGTEKYFVYRVSPSPSSNFGSAYDYLAANTLVLNNTFTATLPTAANIAAGNYKESLGITQGGTVTLEPIFSSFAGKQISGNWTLIIRDHASPDAATLHSWKLRFAPGAVKL